jgi:hypothetical protein
VTISNILEGAVTYIPQTESLSSSPVNAMTQESKNIPSTSTTTHTLANTVQVIYQIFSLHDIKFMLLCLTKYKTV